MRGGRQTSVVDTVSAYMLVCALINCRLCPPRQLLSPRVNGCVMATRLPERSSYNGRGSEAYKRHRMTSGLGKSCFSAGSSYDASPDAGLSLDKYTEWNGWSCMIRSCEMCTIEQHWFSQSWIIRHRGSKTHLLTQCPVVTYCTRQKRMSRKKEPQCVISL